LSRRSGKIVARGFGFSVRVDLPRAAGVRREGGDEAREDVAYEGVARAA
jgi:hypothetical protein